MKKTASIVFIFMLAFEIISCGPSSEERLAEEKRIADSVAAATAAAIQDSLQKVQEAEMAAQKAMEDSLKMKAMQDSLAAVQEQLKKASTPKPKSKPKTTEPSKPTKPEEWKAGQGKG